MNDEPISQESNFQESSHPVPFSWQNKEVGTMDVTGSLRKISKELKELDPDQPDLGKHLQAASWLIHYIADCLDVELMYAAERGRKLKEEASKNNANIYNPSDSTGPNGVKEFKVISGENL